MSLKWGRLQVHISADSFSCSSYGLFLRETAMALTSCFPDRVNGYALTTSNYFKVSKGKGFGEMNDACNKYVSCFGMCMNRSSCAC